MKQTDEILDYMKRNGGKITPAQAYGFGCLRLAARISDLKRAGHRIETQMISYVTPSGSRVQYAEYHLIEEAPA